MQVVQAAVLNAVDHTCLPKDFRPNPGIGMRIFTINAMEEVLQFAKFLIGLKKML
jgi:hypothetical protein